MIRDFITLNRLSILQLKNRLKSSLSQSPVKFLFFTFMVLAFYYGFLQLSIMLTRFIYFQEVYGQLLAGKLVQILLLISVGVALMSSLTLSLSHLYLSKDLEFHFALPIPFNTWMLLRVFQIFLQTNWMLLLFGGPLIWMYLTYSETHWSLRVLGLLILAIVCSFPVIFSVLLAILLVKVFPARRVHQVFLVLTVVLVSSLILVFRYMEPEKFIGPGGLERFRGFVDLVELDEKSWNPATLAYNVIVVLGQKTWGHEEWSILVGSGSLLLGYLAVAVVTLLLLARRFYRGSWDRALQSLAGESDFRKAHKKVSGLSRLLGHPRWCQEARELLLFLRDPAQWSQIFVLIALLGLCLFSLTKVPHDPFGVTKYTFAMGGSSFTAFIALSIASRFVFTSFSAEGQAIWLMKTTPEGWVKFMRGKLVIYGIPILIFAELLNIFSGLILGLNFRELLLLGFNCFWDSSVMILLALAFGMLFITPDIDNPVKLIVSSGGILLMSTGLFLIMIHVSLRLGVQNPTLNELFMRIGWPDMQGGRAPWYFLGLIFVEGLILWSLIVRGIRHLRKGHFA